MKKTLGDYIEALNIMAEYAKAGLGTSHFFTGAHDVIYSGLTEEDLSEKSEDGKRLQALGWFIDEECWAIFT